MNEPPIGPGISDAELAARKQMPACHPSEGEDACRVAKRPTDVSPISHHDIRIPENIVIEVI